MAASAPGADRSIAGGSDGAARRRELLGVLLLALAISFAGLFQHDLWTPDEPREAEIGREMFADGLSSQPTLGGEPFLEKPPLHLWCMAIAYQLFGVSDGVARIPAALAGVAALLISYGFGRRVGGARAGLLTMLALASMVEFTQVMHKSVNDSMLTTFVAGGHFAFLVARERCTGVGGRAWPAFAAAGLCASLAFLTKGVIGPVLAAGPPILAVIAMRDWKFLRQSLAPMAFFGALFLAALGLPWVIALAEKAGWEAVNVCLVKNTLGRGLDDSERFGISGHSNAPWYYVVIFPSLTLPWIVALPSIAMSKLFRRESPERSGDDGRLAFVGWLVLAGFLLLSIPAAKRELYAAPLIPATAVIVGAWLARVGGEIRPRFERLTLGALHGVLALLLLLTTTVLVLITTSWLNDLSNSFNHLAARGKLFAKLAEKFAEWTAMLDRISEQRSHAAIYFTAAILLGMAVWCRRETWRSFRAIDARSATRAAATAFAAFFLYHAALVPLIDPMKSMRRGALDVARAVPGDGPILAFAPDETTRAVVEFYAGRRVVELTTWDAALARLAETAEPYLLLLDKDRRDEQPLPQAERGRFSLAARIDFSATRTARVVKYDRALPGSPPPR